MMSIPFYHTPTHEGHNRKGPKAPEKGPTKLPASSQPALLFRVSICIQNEGLSAREAKNYEAGL